MKTEPKLAIGTILNLKKEYAWWTEKLPTPSSVIIGETSSHLYAVRDYGMWVTWLTAEEIAERYNLVAQPVGAEK